ncbi:MAG: S26 family signal peptidase [Candidatus Berkelbacteria bacterium]
MLRILIKILVVLAIVLIASTVTDQVAAPAYPVGEGKSMFPFTRDGQRCLFIRPWRAIKPDDVVLVVTKKDETIKRVYSRSGDWIWLLGDNRKESWDSRHYGWVNVSCVKKLCLFRLPRMFDGETCTEKPRDGHQLTEQQKLDGKIEADRAKLVKSAFLKSYDASWHQYDGLTLNGSSKASKPIRLPKPCHHIGICAGGSASAPIKVHTAKSVIGECRGSTGGIKEFFSKDDPIISIELTIEDDAPPGQTVTLEAVRMMP